MYFAERKVLIIVFYLIINSDCYLFILFLNLRMLAPKPQVQQTLDLRQAQSRVKNSITWFLINGALLSILLFDL